jgi:CRP-like cAMP-binding protein
MNKKRIIELFKETAPQSLSAQNLAARLQHDEFFSLFSPEVREQIFSKAIYKDYKPKDIVFYRGDTDVFMGVVMAGRLRMNITESDGRTVLIDMAEVGEVFGETALLDGLPRTTDAEADTKTRLMLIRRDDFLPALKEHPEAMLGVIKMLCHRLRIYLDTIDLIGLQNLSRRLARLLLRLAVDYGIEQDGQITIRSGLNQSLLGQKLATSRESINKQLKDFATQGLISFKGNEITLIKIEELHHLSG